MENSMAFILMAILVAVILLGIGFIYGMAYEFKRIKSKQITKTATCWQDFYPNMKWMEDELRYEMVIRIPLRDIMEWEWRR